MIVREYADENLSDLTCLMNQWSNEMQYRSDEIENCIKQMREKSENKIFIAQNEEGKAVGYVFTGICYYLGANPFAEIIQLLVDKDYRSQGAGAMLVDHVCTYYKPQGINDIKLHSRVDRERAHNFYRAHGFREFKQSKFFEKEL